MVEAYLGAIFVDSGFNFEVIETFYQRHIKSYFEDMSIYDTFANKHPTVRPSFSLCTAKVESDPLIVPRRFCATDWQLTSAA